MESNQPRDEQLWRIAKKRAGFKRSLLVYVIIIAFLWVIWWFSSGRRDGEWDGIPWPLWVMFGWGIAIVMQYFNAYGGKGGDLVESEYRRLKEERDRTGK